MSKLSGKIKDFISSRVDLRFLAYCLIPVIVTGVVFWYYGFWGVPADNATGFGGYIAATLFVVLVIAIVFLKKRSSRAVLLVFLILMLVWGVPLFGITGDELAASAANIIYFMAVPASLLIASYGYRSRWYDKLKQKREEKKAAKATNTDPDANAGNASVSSTA